MSDTLPRTRLLLLGDTPWDAFFQFGVVTAGLLVILVLALTVVLFFLRLRNRSRTHHWSRLERLWEPLLLDVLHGGAPPGGLAEQVPRDDRAFFLRFLLGYADRLRGPERQAVESLALPYLDAVLPRLTHRNPERRAVAVRTLGVLGLPTHAPRLVAALDDPAPLVRFTAAQGLLAEGAVDLAAEVVDRLDNFGSWTGHALAGALATAGREVAPLLRVTLADPFTPAPAAALAAHALRLIGDPHAADAAVSVLEARGQRDVVVECLHLLGNVGHGAHTAVVRTFTDHPNFAVRARAVGALGAMGSAEDADLLKKAVDDSSPWVAMQAARALERLGRDDLLRELDRGGTEGAVFARQALEDAGP